MEKEGRPDLEVPPPRRFPGTPLLNADHGTDRKHSKMSVVRGQRTTDIFRTTIIPALMLAIASGQG
jgi:hypothetical protein